MTQQELNHQIANRTGESIHTIESMGFSPLQSVIPIEERQKPLMVDWDALETIRHQRGLYWLHVHRLTRFTSTARLPLQHSLESHLAHGWSSWLRWLSPLEARCKMARSAQHRPVKEAIPKTVDEGETSLSTAQIFPVQVDLTRIFPCNKKLRWASVRGAFSPSRTQSTKN